MLDLKLLKTFVVLGRLLHFGRAAQALHATQPGVTQHIMKLEEQLGFALLKRSKRAVALTDAGELFMRHASRLLLMAERMEEEARAVAAGQGGQLALGLSSAIVYSDIPDRITRFKQSRPGVNVKLVVHSGDRLRELLDAHALDAAITTLPLEGEGCHCAVLNTHTPMGVALPASHPLAGRRRLSLRSLAKEAFVVVPREQHPEAHDSLTAVLRAGGDTARISGHEVSFPNMIARVAIGEGLAVVPLAYANMAPAQVRVVPLADPELAQLRIYLVTQADGDHPAMAAFAQALEG